MARDNFISDNLINIREKLRQDTAVQNTDSAANFVQTEKIDNVSIPQELPTPAPRMQVKTPELDHERRALIGKIRRDYTLAAAELEIAENKKHETAVFMKFLADQQKALENLDFDRTDISRELDRLTWAYYQHAGRWRAFSPEKSEQRTVNAVSEVPRQNNVLLAAAIVISAVIISVTLLAVFM